MYNKEYNKLVGVFLVKDKNKRSIYRGLFIIYLIGMAYLLFFSERYGRTSQSQGYRYNLVLFHEIKRYVSYYDIIGTEGMVLNLIGNVIAFMPFGFGLSLFKRGKIGIFLAFFLSFAFSFCIESIQLLYKIGIFDVDDLLLNTIGGVLGYLVYRFIKALKRGST